MIDLDNREVVTYYLRTKTGMFLEETDGRSTVKLTSKRCYASGNYDKYRHEGLRDKLREEAGLEFFVEEYVVKTRSDFSPHGFE